MNIASGILLGISALIVSATGQSPDEARPPSGGLAGFWRFDEDTRNGGANGISEHSSHERQAILSVGAGIAKSGKIGAALTLDGQDGSAKCPDAMALNPNRQLTLMCWFRLKKGTLDVQKVLVGKGAPVHAAPFYQYAIAGMDRADIPATLTFYAAVNGTMHTCSARDLPHDLYSGWHHVAGTYDGRTMRLYLNGREVAAAHAEGPLSTYPTPLVMGAYGNLPHNATYCLAGALDEVALYDRALRAQEIGEYYWQAQHDLVLSRPGNGEAFGRVANDHAAIQPFTALGPSLESAAIWLCEANDDELQVQVRESNAEGRVLGMASLSAGPVGKRSILFDPPVSLRTDHVYVLRVSAGAPGTTRGTVQRQVSGAGTKGLTEIGPSEHSMAIELRFLPCVIRSVARARSRRPKTEADIRYEEAVNAALNAKRDIWGEQLISRAEGPTYENIIDYLRPMLWIGDYVTTSGVYYLVFGQHDGVTGGGDAALHVADGSEIISRHHKTGRRTAFFVGTKGRELFGTNLDRLEGPRLHLGYQPVLLNEYQDSEGIRWEHESFATHIPETDSLVSFVRFTRRADPEQDKSATLRIRTTLTDAIIQGNRLVSGNGTVLVFQPGAVFEPPFLTYTFPEDSRTSSVFLVRLNQPAACKELLPNAERFASEREGVCDFWNAHLARGALLEVPEKRVMDAMRNLLIQNLFMTWRYSIGNAYESWYPQESGDALRALGEYGFLEEYRDNLQVLLPLTFRGDDERMVEYAHKLFYTAHCARLTGDVEWLEANRPLIRRWIQGMCDVMARDPKGLLGKTRAGDIHTHCYYSNHQAIGWRGLRDMAMLYADLGWDDDARIAADAAASLREAFLKSFHATKVDMPDGTLFFPKVLKDAPATPYDPITATRLGSYWNLSIGTTLKSGIFDPRGPTMRRTVDYMFQHGARLLGLTRFNYYPVHVGSHRPGGLPGYSTSGADNVYGPGILDAIAELDEADQIVLSLYGKLAHGMTRNTFISGEGDSFGVVPGQYYRALYLPPSNTNNALFLKTLHDTLVYTHVDEEGRPEELLLGHFTPRAWLDHGKTIRVERAPTVFGPVSFTLCSQLDEGTVTADVVPPTRQSPKRLNLRLRVPVSHKLQAVRVNGRPHKQFDAESATIRLGDVEGEAHVIATFSTN